MGRIADRWAEMSDEQKLAELREPTLTRSEIKPRSKPPSKSPSNADILKSFENLVVRVRRKAMALDTLVERAELVDRTWAKLKRDFRKAGVAADFAAVVRQVLYSETIAWPWFGHREDYPPGEGE
jgi:hypothetical protein